METTSSESGSSTAGARSDCSSVGTVTGSINQDFHSSTSSITSGGGMSVNIEDTEMRDGDGDEGGQEEEISDGGHSRDGSEDV